MDKIKGIQPLLTRDEVVKITNLSKCTLIRFDKDGRLPAVRIGRRVGYRMDDVNKFIGQA